MSLIACNQNEGMLWLNGTHIPWDEARIHILNAHSLHYSGAVFEGIKAYNGKIFKAKQHMERLIHSASVFSLHIEYDANSLVQIAYEVMQHNNLKDCYIRPLVWAEAETTKIGAKTSSNALIAAWQPHIPPSSDDKEVILSKWVKAPPNSYDYQAKSSGNYSNILLSLRAAQQNGYDDALMLDWRGNIAELSSSNIFFVKNNSIYTPIADCFLNGITRQTVLQIAQECNINIYEQHLGLEELKDFDECFATGTACGIATISSITDKSTKYSFNKTKITSIIREAYKQLTRLP